MQIAVLNTNSRSHTQIYTAPLTQSLASPLCFHGNSCTRNRIYRFPGIPGVEDLEAYCPGGGYCPVNLGDIFDSGQDKYTILHKLGFGRSSTVWLVKRKRKDRVEPTFHALKILRADLSQPAPEVPPQVNIFHRLGQEGWMCSRQPGLVPLQCWFRATSANGEHDCFVFPLCGPSLDDQWLLRGLAEDTRRIVCRKLADALSYLHLYEVCHSDLSPSHVLFKLPSHHLVSETPIRRCLGPVASEKIYLANGKPPSKHSPRAVVQPASFSNLDFSQLRNIALVGFGKAFVESTPPPTLHCPTNILPPEVFFGYPPSSKSDIWQLACLFFKIHTGAYPFRTTLPYEWLVKQATEYIGPVPRHWRDRYDRDGSEARTAGLDLEEWFDKNQPTKFLDDYLCEEGHLSNVAERQDLARLLFEMLAWQPDKPPQAGMVVDYMYLIWLGR